MPIFGIDRKIDNILKRERQQKAIFARNNEFIGREFFQNNKSLNQVLDEIVEIVNIKKNRPLVLSQTINQYMIYNKIWDNYNEYGIGNEVRKIFNNKAMQKKTIQQRSKDIISLIESEKDEKEILTVETFFINRMAKIVDAIMRNCLTQDELNKYKKLFNEMLRNNQLTNFPNLNKVDLRKIKEFFNGNSKEISRFKSYVKSRYCTQKLYDMKNKNIVKLCKKYSENVKYTKDKKYDNMYVVSIQLEDYALPIKFHQKVDSFNPSDFEIDQDDNIIGGFQAFPIKLNNEEMRIYRRIMARYEKNNSQQITGITSNTPVNIVENNDNIVIKGVSKIENIKGKRTSKLRENGEVVDEIINILKNSEVLSEIPDEYNAKLLSVSKEQKCKMDKIFINIKKYLEEINVDKEKINVEAAKHFFFMKVLDRGFWQYNYEKGLKNYKKITKELSLSGEEFFDRINEGCPVEDLKLHMKKVCPHKHSIEKVSTVDNNLVLNGEKKEVIIESTNAIKTETQNENVKGQQNKGNDVPKKTESLHENLDITLSKAISRLRSEYAELDKAKAKLLEKINDLKRKISELGDKTKSIEEKLKQVNEILKIEQDTEFLQEIGEYNILLNKKKVLEKRLKELEGKRKITTQEISENKEKIGEIEKKQASIKKQVTERFEDL